MSKDHKLFFYDRCGMPRDAIRGKKTTTRIILGCELPELMLFHAEILDTKIQHLQEITDDEIRTEGIMLLDDGRAAFNDTTKEFCQAQIFKSPREAYKAFIDLSEGEYIWEYDPWALVVEFKVVDADKYEVL